jgi:uncharacterized protein YggE
MNGTLSTRTSGRIGWVATAAVGGLLIGLVAGPVMAGAVAPRTFAPTNAATDQPPEHTISVVGTGTVVVVPDMATIRLGVSVERKTARAARDDAARAMTAVIAAIRKLGVEERDIATSTVSLGPVYDYPQNATPRIRGYQLQNVVTVTVRKLDAVSDLVDGSVSAGATTVDGITFDVADRTAAEATAREAAVKDAKARAETLAAGVGVRIAGVASISESVSTPVWYGREYTFGAAQADAATPVLGGTTDVVITVSIAFLIG